MRRAPATADPETSERTPSSRIGTPASRSSLARKPPSGEAAHVRLELFAVQRERSLGQLPLRTAQSQFARHQQNLMPHNVIMKQTDL